MLQIYKYTPEAQDFVKSKAKSEPWLHIAIAPNGDYDIYVWDTRQVIESGRAKRIPVTVADCELNFAEDNLSALQGNNKTGKLMQNLQKFVSNAVRVAQSAASITGKRNVIDCFCKQIIYSSPRFKDERYYTWLIGVKYPLKRRFKETVETTWRLARIYADNRADYMATDYDYDGRHPEEASKLKELVAKLGIEPVMSEYKAGATPCSATFKE